MAIPSVFALVGLVVLAVIVMVVSALASREGGKTLLVTLAGMGVVGVFLFGALGAFLLAPSGSDDGRYESTITVTSGDDSLKYNRSVKVTSGERVASDRSGRRLELLPTPAEPAKKPSSDEIVVSEEDSGEESEKPDWMLLKESGELGTSLAVVSEGPRPSKNECRDMIRHQVALGLIRYAAENDMRALLGRPKLLTEDLLNDVVREEYFSTSPHEFSGEQQTWYTLHQLLEFDSGVHSRLEQIHNRAVVNQRLMITGAAAAGVFGLLGVVFLMLKSGGTKRTTSDSASTSTAWQLGFQNTEEAKGIAPLVAAIAFGVAVLVGLVAVLI